MIPGSNLLNAALTIIAKQTVIYYEYLGRVSNDVGQDVTSYSPGRPIVGSFQPVPRQLYEIYGLDLQKEYFTLYSSNNVRDVSRDISGDQLAYNGQRFQCESNNNWYTADGWKGILCVKIGLDWGNATVFGFNEAPAVNENVNFQHGNFLPGDT